MCKIIKNNKTLSFQPSGFSAADFLYFWVNFNEIQTAWKQSFEKQQAQQSWYTKSKFCVLTAPLVREKFSLKPFNNFCFQDWKSGVWGFSLTSCYRYKSNTDNLACRIWFKIFPDRIKIKSPAKIYKQDLILFLEYVIIRQWVKYTHYCLIVVAKLQSNTENKVTHITCSAVNLCNHPNHQDYYIIISDNLQ